MPRREWEKGPSAPTTATAHVAQTTPNTTDATANVTNPIPRPRNAAQTTPKPRRDRKGALSPNPTKSNSTPANNRRYNGPQQLVRPHLILLITATISAQDALTTQYCLACHNPQAKAGNFILTGTPQARPDLWEKAAKRLRAGEMPPPGLPRPDATTTKTYLTKLIQELDQQKPFAGRPAIRRLNRTEYSNAIRDLLALDLPNLKDELPPDQTAAGFDNIADALSLSPLLLENYLRVARKISGLATGTGDASPVVDIYPAKGTQAAWQGEGLPFGTRGGLRVTHFFPRDGDYDLRAFLQKESLTPLEGVRFFRTRLKGVRAGSHSVIVTFPDEFAEREGPVSDVGGPGGAPLGGPLDVLGTAIRPTLDFRLDGRRVKLFDIRGMTAGEAAFDGQPGPPALARIEIAGPYDATGPGDTPSRRRIFTCHEDTQACAEKILKPIARRAWRRDLTPTDLQPILATWQRARTAACDAPATQPTPTIESNQPSPSIRQTRPYRGPTVREGSSQAGSPQTTCANAFEPAIAAALREILLAPDFLFRLEFDTPTGELTQTELASRLSFFLWSSLPDDTLLDTAARGQLKPNLEREVRRLLADPRSGALLDNFATQWLGLNTLSSIEPDRALFPAYDRGLSAAFAEETRLFLGSLIRDNRPLLSLINAGYSYLNDRLAAHYGIPGVTGPGFRRVALSPESHRHGLLTQGSILLLTSHATRTSPVLRGKWILDNLLNSPPPLPPPNVPPLDESPKDGRKLTAREQVERHRNNPTCAACHNRIDPLGFVMENYDVLGRYRTHEDNTPLDTTAKMPGGFEMRGITGLGAMLDERKDEFAQATVERLLTYAVGRELEARDMPAVRQILRETAPAGYRLQDLIVAVTRSVPFRFRQKQD